MTLLTFGYMLPWAVAASRGKSNQAAVGVIGLFLGWTFIGSWWGAVDEANVIEQNRKLRRLTDRIEAQVGNA